jgi:signal transduction histidine kinase
VLTYILNDFLSVGKIEEGKIEVLLSTFVLPKYIDNIVQELQTHVKNGQKIVYEHVGTKEVMLDTSMLKHIAMNLLTNAIKFSYENSEVNIKTIVSNDTITLAVKDRGIGISYEDQQHLMERFFRGTNATNIQGTGLGLHIVSKYVELMNGKITCISELEKGTEFIVIFNIKTNTDEDLITDRRQ